ncbi:MAG TPA: hypothetical protein VI357_11515 [Mycobacteriales bacterium]
MTAAGALRVALGEGDVLLREGIARRGTGLTGLHDRVAANDGRLTISSPPGQGTHVQALLPTS